MIRVEKATVQLELEDVYEACRPSAETSKLRVDFSGTVWCMYNRLSGSITSDLRASSARNFRMSSRPTARGFSNAIGHGSAECRIDRRRPHTSLNASATVEEELWNAMQASYAGWRTPVKWRGCR